MATVYSSSIGNKYNSGVKPSTRRKHNKKKKGNNKKSNGLKKQWNKISTAASGVVTLQLHKLKQVYHFKI